MKEIAIGTETIRLGQLLKMAGMVGTGGEAKLRIQGGEAKVNGEVEVRRGRQLRPGDMIDFGGETLIVIDSGTARGLGHITVAKNGRPE